MKNELLWSVQYQRGKVKVALALLDNVTKKELDNTTGVDTSDLTTKNILLL